MHSLIMAAMLVTLYYLNRQSPWFLFLAGMIADGGIWDIVRKYDHGQPLMTWNEFVYAAVIIAATLVAIWIRTKRALHE